MNEDCLKLTTYFGERDRTDGQLLADALLDLYGRHELQASVLLRGIEGFGSERHVHTDRLLTLSEDLPVVSVAVDTRERIEQVLPEVLAMKQRGLVTLERARLLSGRWTTPNLDALIEATKLTVYVGRRERASGRPAYITVCEMLHRRGISGATVLLGVDGTRQGQRSRAQFFARNPDVPMMIIAIGAGEQMERVLLELRPLLPRPLITLERVQVCKRDGELLATPHALPQADASGLPLWQKLMIHSGERARFEGQPLHRILVRRLREGGFAGATSLRAVWGFHGDHGPHGDRFLQVRRRAPALTIVVDTPERITGAFEIVDECTVEAGLVTSEMVPAAIAPARDSPVAGRTHLRSGLRLARHRF